MSNRPNVELSDGVVWLRCLSTSDAEAHVAGEDDDQRRWLSGGRSTVEGVRSWIASNQNEWAASGPRRNFGVYDEGDQLIGNAEANLDLEMLDAGEVNISYCVFPEARGRRVASRAVTLLCEWLASVPGAEVAVIQVDFDNVHSLNVPARAGFVEKGTVTAPEGVVRRRFERQLH